MSRSLASALVVGFVSAVAALGPSVLPTTTPMTTVSYTLPSKPVTGPASERKIVSIPDVGVPKAESKKAQKPQAIVIKDVKEIERRRAAAQEAAEKAEKARKAEAARKAKAAQAAKPATTKTTKSTTKSTASTTSRSKNRAATSVSSGTKSNYNWATPGQCTWGALEQWRRSTGWYLGGFHGNAMDWGWKARNAGHSVGYNPRSRSVIVMQPGVAGSSSVGHVGWVTSVSGNKVTIIEMNALAGPYNYNTRTVTHQGGMSYIYAP